MNTKSYAGRCHCGAVRFKFASEEIKTGLRCNCSICFCRICGIAPFNSVASIPADYQGSAKPGNCRVNLGCVDDLDGLALSIELVDGRSFQLDSQ